MRDSHLVIENWKVNPTVVLSSSVGTIVDVGACSNNAIAMVKGALTAKSNTAMSNWTRILTGLPGRNSYTSSGNGNMFFNVMADSNMFTKFYVDLSGNLYARCNHIATIDFCLLYPI